MDETRYSPCLALIRASYAYLTDAERHVADFILAHPGQVLSYSIAEVARESGVGLATVNRLCGKLGYRSFVDMKIGLAVEQLNPQYAEPEPIQEDDPPADVIRKVFEFGIQNLRATTALFDPSALTEAADVIMRATRVDVYATGGLSGPIASIMQHRLLNLGVPCVVFTNPQQQSLSAALLGTGMVAVGLSHSGESIPVASALEIARRSGATTICVTSAPQSSAAHMADTVLLTSSQEVNLWSDQVTSRLPMLSVIETLYALIALHKHRQNQLVSLPVGSAESAAPSLSEQ